MEAMLAAAWLGTNRAAYAAGNARALLNDALQAGRTWAQLVLDDALDEGLVDLVKRHQKKTVVTKRGAIGLVVGALDQREDGTVEPVQLELELLTREQVRKAIELRGTQVEAASRNIWALRVLDALLARNPDAVIVRDALTAEGLTLEQLLAAS